MKNFVKILSVLFCLSFPLWSKKPTYDLELLLKLEKIIIKKVELDSDWDKKALTRSKKRAFAPKVDLIFDIDKGLGSNIKNSKDLFKQNYKKENLSLGVLLKVSFDFGASIYKDSELDLKKFSLSKFEKRQRLIKKIHENFFWLAKHHKNVKSKKIDIQKKIALLNSLSDGAFIKLLNED